MQRRLRVSLGVTAISLLATSCDPLAGVKLRTAIAPAPAPGCVDSALAASRASVQATPQERTAYQQMHGEQEYAARFLNGDARPAAARLEVRTTGDSVAHLELSFLWIGNLKSVSDTTRTWMAVQGRTLLSDVIARCARAPADSVSCEQFELFARHSPSC